MLVQASKSIMLCFGCYHSYAASHHASNGRRGGLLRWEICSPEPVHRRYIYFVLQLRGIEGSGPW